MSTRMKLANVATRMLDPSSGRQLLAPTTRQELSVSYYHSSPTTSPPIIIDAPSTAVPVDTATLSNYLRLGRMYHPLCRHAFVEKRMVGYYHYERCVAYRTCAVAAAYAGAFGPQSIERPDFSYSMAVWRLSQKVGYDLNGRSVYGPTGRYQPIAEEMMQLVDKDYWTREGLVEWLASVGL